MADSAETVQALQTQISSVKRKLDAVNEEIAVLNKKRQALTKQHNELEAKLNAVRLDKLSRQSQSASSPYDRTSGFPWSDEVNRVRAELFHIPGFRPLQLRAINATLDGKDLILVMPTGAGKSLVYQLPALLDHTKFSNSQTKLSTFNPITLVISPLVSLMTDQTMSLNRLGLPAGTVAVFDASTPLPDQKRILDQLAATRQKSAASAVPLRLLFVTPEKLAKSKRLMNRLETVYANGRLARIAIDEVHCVSQWGHDFRPDYQFLHVLRRQFPSVPLLGLTATASAELIVDIQSMLGLNSEQCLVIRSGYNRVNLFYEVQLATGSIKASIKELYGIIKMRYPNQSGIIYCFSQKDTEDVAHGLRELGLKAACYHASMEPQHRSEIHTRWFDEKILIMVATVAFGMGIDKSNVRFVLHYSTSKSLENYYQESGRAGRDARPAECLLVWRFGDLFRLASMVSAERTGLPKLYHMIAYCLDPVTCRRQLIAQHLMDASWSPEDCPNACDNCRRRSDEGEGFVSHINVADLIRAVCGLITSHTDRKQERITGLKLVDLMSANTEVQRVLSRIRPGVRSRDDRPFYEHFVAWALINRWFKMEFHFTPYSTVCYVAPGQSVDTDVLIMPYLEHGKGGPLKRAPENRDGSTESTKKLRPDGDGPIVVESDED